MLKFHNVKIHVFTLFPEFFEAFLAHSIMKRAVEKKCALFEVHNLRDYTHDRHRTCDDRPFGGGPGMLMKPEPIFEAVEKTLAGRILPGRRRQARGKYFKRSRAFRFIALSPQGRPFSQRMAQDLARCDELAFVCGHYEGIDERVTERLVTDEISLGDYVLTGGELPAMVVADAVVRLLPGVLGREESKEFESFSRNLLEYPQYTRPADYRGMKVPPVLLSGNHKAIELWRQQQAYKRTSKRRPDLLR